MRNLANNIFRFYYHQRFRRLEAFMQEPHKAQQDVFAALLEAGIQTEWGRQYDFKSITSAQDFSTKTPLQDYESLKPYIQRMMMGEKNVLWPGQVSMFSKSSGTTNDKSKFIPVSDINFKDCHIRGTWDTMTVLYNQHPDCKIFAGKNFLMAGNHKTYEPFPETIYGDVSALMIRNMPMVARPFFEPEFDVVFQDDWERKIKLMAEKALDDEIAPDITMVGGVPTWVIVFFRQILEMSGRSHMLEVWPNFEAYIHGGVNIEPYREQLRQLLPSDDVVYLNVYNASEGYFGTQLELGNTDLLLLLDNGVYYEFMPMEEWDKEAPQTIPLEGVQTGVIYALVISTNAGLWRYAIGDTIEFTSTNPYTFKIKGRTQQFINAFGEEVMIDNTDKAIAASCEKTGAIVSEYTVAPTYFSGVAKGNHQWLVEFEKMPADLDIFARLLDKQLQRINSDYEAKRYKDMALEQLQLEALPTGTFHNWLRSKGKYGGQSKVPRLSNNRKYVDEILAFAQLQK